MPAPGGSRSSVIVLADQLCARVPGGTGRYVEELLGALAAVPPPGWELLAALPRRCPDHVTLPVAVRPLRLPMPILARLWERGLPPRLGGATIVHAPTLMVPRVSRRRRLIVTIHDVVPWTHPETLTRHGAAFHQRMGARAAREADAIVTPTEAVASQVRSLLHPGCLVVAVPSGVRVSPPGPDAEARRRELGASGRYVLFVGTAEPRKGLDVLVAALARSELAGWVLVVVGPSGWGGVSVADLAAEAGVDDRVRVTGRISERELSALYAGASVLAMPSRAEGFGFPVVEAMAHGVPVVVSDAPALLEVAGGAALHVPVGEVESLALAIERAGAEGWQRDQRVAEGRTRAAQFSWATTATRMWSLYETGAC